MEIDHALLRV
jgi:hypothetical protein